MVGSCRNRRAYAPWKGWSAKGGRWGGGRSFCCHLIIFHDKDGVDWFVYMWIMYLNVHLLNNLWFSFQLRCAVCFVIPNIFFHQGLFQTQQPYTRPTRPARATRPMDPTGPPMRQDTPGSQDPTNPQDQSWLQNPP